MASLYHDPVLLALSLLVAVPPPADEPLMPPMARTDLIAVFQQMVAAMDGDHDGRVSRAEWSDATSGTGEIDRAIPIRIALDDSPEAAFRDLDSNTDGLLSFEEFVREPLANFDCMDADHDGIVQPAENQAEETRCSSGQVPEPAAATPNPAPAP